MNDENTNKGGKIVLLIFLLICSGLGIAAFTMSFTKKCGEGFSNKLYPPLDDCTNVMASPSQGCLCDCGFSFGSPSCNQPTCDRNTQKTMCQMPLVNESITKSPCKKLNYPCDPSKKNSDCNSPSSSPSCDLKCLKTHNFPFLPVDSPGDQYRCIKNDNPKCIDYNFQTNLIQIGRAHV